MSVGLREEGKEVVEKSYVHDAVKVDDAQVAGKKLEHSCHISWWRRFGVVKATIGKLAAGILPGFIHSKVILIRG